MLVFFFQLAQHDQLIRRALRFLVRLPLLKVMTKDLSHTTKGIERLVVQSVTLHN